MSEDALTGAEVAVVCGYLGLSPRALTEVLNCGPQGSKKIGERTVERWFDGNSFIPQWAADEIERLEAKTAEAVGALVKQVLDEGDLHPELAVATYHTNREFWEHRPDLAPFPASWHRQICARVAHEIPGLRLVYWQEGDDGAENAGAARSRAG